MGTDIHTTCMIDMAAIDIYIRVYTLLMTRLQEPRFVVGNVFRPLSLHRSSIREGVLLVRVEGMVTVGAGRKALVKGRRPY